ncbi:hypothetical protein F8514_20770 [Bacillus toyonensis]|nr:hypothetical protein F8514_20770 [Bacillus toyonensis]HDR7537310.1 hypothetical protein [Bacillus toyonensis]
MRNYLSQKNIYFKKSPLESRRRMIIIWSVRDSAILREDVMIMKKTKGRKKKLDVEIRFWGFKLFVKYSA